MSEELKAEVPAKEEKAEKVYKLFKAVRSGPNRHQRRQAMATMNSLKGRKRLKTKGAFGSKKLFISLSSKKN